MDRDRKNKPRLQAGGIWLACVAAAVALAYATPHERTFVGQMPSVAARTGDQRPVQLPRELPGDRTLALLSFSAQQREEARTWIRGMRLKETPGVQWVKLHVGETDNHAHAGGTGSHRSLQVSADRDAVVQSLRLRGADHLHALVLDRDGKVLARVEGPWDEEKEQSILLALLAP